MGLCTVEARLTQQFKHFILVPMLYWKLLCVHSTVSVNYYHFQHLVTVKIGHGCFPLVSSLLCAVHEIVI